MTQLSFEQVIQKALAHHQAGRLADAERLYRQVLTANPNQQDALHLLGVIAHQVGRNDVSLDLIQRAIQIFPNNPAFYGNLGVTLDALGRTDEAIQMWNRALSMNPHYVEALNNLGRALDRKGKLDEAVACWVQGITIKPDFAEFYNNLGVARVRQQRVPEANELFRQALQRDPAYVEAYQNLGAMLWEERKYVEARECFEKILAIKPNWARAYCGLGDVARAEKKYAEARQHYDRAMAADPTIPDTYHALGLLCREQELLPEAETWLRQAVARNPNAAEWISNLGTILQELGRVAEGLSWLDRALAILPAHPGIHFNRSLMLLLLGRLEEGWREYAYRVQCKEFVFLQRKFSQTTWSGQDLKGRRIYLYAEQGFGDAIHFVRYAALVAQRGGRVIIECQPGVASLLATAPGVSQVVVRGAPLPEFEFQISLLDVPRVFGATLGQIPAQVPYLHVDEERRSSWKKRIAEAAPHDGKLKVGLVWAGNPANASEWKRSMRLEQFAPLAQIPNVRFFSLQKGDPAAQAARPPDGMEMVNLMDDVKDFLDTAAIIQQLDLVIGCDTSVIHLAGALACPVWTLLPLSPDWRWMLDRTDTPWYPTMRLFRQPKLRDWPSTVRNVADALRQWAAIRNTPAETTA